MAISSLKWNSRACLLSLTSVCVVATLALISPSLAEAGSGKQDKLTNDGWVFRVQYGSTERNRTTSLVNFVYIAAAAPGVRVTASAHPTVEIYSENDAPEAATTSSQVERSPARPR
jgi:hypothetical protein